MKYIDPEKAIAEIRKWYWDADIQKCAQDPCVVDTMIDLFIRTIRDQEPANVREDRRGHWVDGHCTQCKRWHGEWSDIADLPDNPLPVYCPNCGSFNGI